MKLLLAAPLLFVAACDYAKPTDVEKVDDRVTALEERLDAENKAQDDRISSLQAHADSVSTEVASQVLQLRAQLDSLVESGELASSRIDSLLRALGMAEIESALAYVEGILDTDVDYGGELLANGGPIRGRGRDHLLFDIRLQEATSVLLLADSDEDIVFELFRLFPYSYIAQYDQDLSSPYEGFSDRSRFEGSLPAGTYWMLLRSYYRNQSYNFEVQLVAYE